MGKRQKRSPTGSFTGVPVRIVRDVAVATGALSEGRLIPVLFLDASERPELAELLRVHQTMGPGDVTCAWGRREGATGTVALFLEFERPVPLNISLEFDIETRGGLVDLILRSRGLFLSAEILEGPFTPDRLRSAILIEVPDTGFEPIWKDIVFDNFVRAFRRRGLKRPEARQAARELLKDWQRFASLRVPRA